MHHHRCMEVRPNEQCLVVQHLLEVRHQPLLVHAVARESTTEVVVHTARRHGVQRSGDDRTSPRRLVIQVRAQQQFERHRRRKLRCRAETAPSVVEGSVQLSHGCGKDVDWRQLWIGGDLRRSPDVVHQRGDVVGDVLAAVAPCVVDRRHQLQERGFRVVGATEERLGIRSEEHGHRPAAASRHCLTASMYTLSTSGRSSRSTFTFTKSRFITSATSTSSNDSCAIT